MAFSHSDIPYVALDVDLNDHAADSEEAKNNDESSAYTAPSVVEGIRFNTHSGYQEREAVLVRAEQEIGATLATERRGKCADAGLFIGGTSVGVMICMYAIIFGVYVGIKYELESVSSACSDFDWNLNAHCNETDYSGVNSSPAALSFENCTAPLVEAWCRMSTSEDNLEQVLTEVLPGAGVAILFMVCAMFALGKGCRINAKPIPSDNISAANEMTGVNLVELSVGESLQAIRRTKTDSSKAYQRAMATGRAFFSVAGELNIDKKSLVPIIFDYLDCQDLSAELCVDSNKNKGMR